MVILMKDCSQTIQMLIKRATGRKVAVLPTEELTVALNLTREELLSDALELKSPLKDQIGAIFLYNGGHQEATALFEMFGWPNFNPNQAGEEFYQDFFVNGDMDETRAWEIYNAFTPLPAALVFGSTDAIDVAKKIIAKRDLNTQLQFDIGPAKQIALVKGYDDVVNLIDHKFARKY
jgi:hypothetical protein